MSWANRGQTSLETLLRLRPEIFLFLVGLNTALQLCGHQTQYFAPKLKEKYSKAGSRFLPPVHVWFFSLFFLSFFWESSEGIRWRASSFSGAKSLYFSNRGPSLAVHCLELCSSGALWFAFCSYSQPGSVLELVPQDLSILDSASSLPRINSMSNSASSLYKNAMFLGTDKNIICSGISLMYLASQGSG